jgi:hypothetical protein
VEPGYYRTRFMDFMKDRVFRWTSQPEASVSHHHMVAVGGSMSASRPPLDLELKPLSAHGEVL